MARAIWTGTLSFGLVSIPVEVHVAVRDSRPRFRMLHAKDVSPINLERICQKDGRAVAWKDLVKGYEYEKGRFVVLTKEDFAAAALQKTKRIDVLDFVKVDEIDDRFFDKPYYLTSGKGGETAYSLLREALRVSGRIGIAKMILRDVQHLAAVEVIGDALVLSTMRFAEELVDASTLSFPASNHIGKKDLEMATALVENLAAEWKPDRYADDYRKNLMRVINAKMKGKHAELVPERRPLEPDVVNLMERLKQSLAATGRRPARTAQQKARGRHGPRSKKQSAKRRAA